jgi:hypothetical protein
LMASSAQVGGANRSPRTHERRQALRCQRGLAGDIGGRLGRLEMRLAAIAFDPQTVLAHRSDMRATKVTSAPAWASAAPYIPPIPPEP